MMYYMAWKLYFWIYTLLSVLGIAVVIPQIGSFNFGSYEGLVETIIFILGLYSYIYGKKVFESYFWKTFFSFILIYWTIQILVLVIPVPALSFITPNIQGGGNLITIIVSMIITIPALVSVYRLGKNHLFRNREISN